MEGFTYSIKTRSLASLNPDRLHRVSPGRLQVPPAIRGCEPVGKAPTMKTDTKPHYGRTLSTMVAGEDLRRGDFVALFTQVCELPSYFWDDADFSLSPHELVRLTHIPREAGVPLKIMSVSLPFVYVVRPNKTVKTIDLRQTQLVRLAPRCAKTVWKRMRARKRSRGNRS